VRCLDPDPHDPARPRGSVRRDRCEWARRAVWALSIAAALSAWGVLVPGEALAAAAKQKKAVKRPGPPTERRAVSLLRVTLITVNNAVLTRNFSILWSRSSFGLRRKYTARKLRQAFTPFIKQRVDLTPVLDLRPIWNEQPAVDEGGELRLRGWFRTQPRVVRFNLRYVYERSRWRLSLIEVDTTAQAKK